MISDGDNPVQVPGAQATAEIVAEFIRVCAGASSATDAAAQDMEVHGDPFGYAVHCRHGYRQVIVVRDLEEKRGKSLENAAGLGVGCHAGALRLVFRINPIS
jgi:hypothetical protein